MSQLGPRAGQLWSTAAAYKQCRGVDSGRSALFGKLGKLRCWYHEQHSPRWCLNWTQKATCHAPQHHRLNQPVEIFFPQKIRKVTKVKSKDFPAGSQARTGRSWPSPSREKSVRGLEGGVSGPSGIFCPRDLDMKLLRHCRHGTVCCIF